jgi:dihydroorotate dehydrogenase (fumarate)
MFDLSTIYWAPAAGMVKTEGNVLDICQTPVTYIVVGSITVEPRSGNSGARECATLLDRAYINALGLDNLGLDAYTRILPKMFAMTERSGKTLVPSIAGFDSLEYAILARTVYDLGFKNIEINLGCPNVKDGGKQKPIVSFNTSLLRKTITVCADPAPAGTHIYIKLSLYSDPLQLQSVARAIAGIARRYPYLHFFVVASNTFPNCVAYAEDGISIIMARSPDGSEVRMGGGSGGTLFRAMTVGQVLQFVPLLRSANVRIIGCGGVETASDAMEHLRAGAVGFQVGSAVRRYGSRALLDLAMVWPM